MLHDLAQLLETSHTLSPTAHWLERIVTMLDLTSLNAADSKEDIKTLCEKAVTPLGHVAAVCVYPEFVGTAVSALEGTNVNVATVANFPLGTDDMQDVLRSIQASVVLGANEMDVVFPYEFYLAGERSLAREFVRECKKACGHNVLLKVILETGILKKPIIIADATRVVVEGGADFVKTSTGKYEVGATKEAAAVILLTLKEMKENVGLKVAGGVREVGDAMGYIALANEIMGPAWITPQHFRIGASQLIDKLY